MDPAPGGARLLGNVEKELGLCSGDTQPSWDILGNVGNLSSATILSSCRSGCKAAAEERAISDRGFVVLISFAA